MGGGRWVQRGFALIVLTIWPALWAIRPRYALTALLAVVVLGITAGGLGAQLQRFDDFASLSAQLNKLYSERKVDEAIHLAEPAIASMRERVGADSLEYGGALAWLALLYQDRRRYADAELAYERGLVIFEKALGSDHPHVATLLNNLGELYRAQAKYAEAQSAIERSLTIRQKALGSEHPEVAGTLNNLAELYRIQARYGEAEAAYKRSLTISEKVLGPNHLQVGVTLNNLAELYRIQGRYDEAKPRAERSMAITEQVLGANHPEVGIRLNNMAAIYRDQGRYLEAEPLYTRALGIIEKALGPNHPQVGVTLNNLAGLYSFQGRNAEAEKTYKRSLIIREQALGPDHPDVGITLNNLAEFYLGQQRYAEAEPAYRRSLMILEKTFGIDHPNVGVALNNLAALHEAQGQHVEAEQLYRRGLIIREKALGAGHSEVGQSLNNLGVLYHMQGRYAEAEPLYKRALVIREQALGSDHLDVAQTLNNLAQIKFSQRDWAMAADFWRQSTAILRRRTLRGADGIGHALTGKKKGEAEQLAWQFSNLVKAAHRLAAKEGSTEIRLAREMFQTAQWSQSSAAASSLVHMAARGATGNPVLAALVRERQDLVEEWQRRDGVRLTAVSQSPEKRDHANEVENVARLTAIDNRMPEIDKRLAIEFPDYSALARPIPLTVEEVQNHLRLDEGLVLFLDTPEASPTPEETFIWFITKTDIRWVRLGLGTPRSSGKWRRFAADWTRCNGRTKPRQPAAATSSRLNRSMMCTAVSRWRRCPSIRLAPTPSTRPCSARWRT
jgi:tetratricopeptide (TPR) repeat protein